ncbi:MAG: aminotransferase class IV [Polyangiaceae bacterium]|nr:aminotransferase class IV [Polyangiaceae bacterium]
MTIWMNGGLVTPEQARVSVYDHGLLYGDGLFEGLRIANGRVFRLDLHLARLAQGALLIGLDLPDGIADLRRAVATAVAAHGDPSGYARLVVTRGEGALGVDPATCGRPTVFCIVDRLTLFPPEKRTAGIDLVTARVRRPPLDVLDPRVKSLNYLNNALAKLDARRRGADDALLLNAHGTIAEAAVANVFAVRDDELCTPPLTDGALDGITRRTVLELARGFGIPTREASLGHYELVSADEVFLTGTGAGLVPVRTVDGMRVGQGPLSVFERLSGAYQIRVEEDTRAAA